MTGTTGPGNEEPGDAAPVTPPAAGALGAAPGSSPAPRYAGAPPGLSRRRFVAAALLVAGFVVMLVVVMRSTGPPAIDVAVQRWFQDRRTPLLTTVFRGVTDLGSPVGLIITVAVVAGALSVRRRSWRPLLISAVTLGGAELIGTVIKILVGRDRPPLVDRVPDVTANRLDFPSGHSTQSAAAYTILMLLIAQQVPHRIARVLLCGRGRRGRAGRGEPALPGRALVHRRRRVLAARRRVGHHGVGSRAIAGATPTTPAGSPG
jgi:hypothetical protein